MAKKETCDVFMGLCGAYNENQIGNCEVFSVWASYLLMPAPDIQDGITQCAHRLRMCDKTLRKAIRECKISKNHL